MCALHPLFLADGPSVRPSPRAAVLVLGMHRSGTSALTRTLNLLGVDLGDRLLPAAADNASGFWEHRDLVLLNDEVLARLGRRWDDARPIAREQFDDPALAPLREKALSILTRDFTDSTIWGMKDPRLCRLLPFWMPVLEAFDSSPHFVLALRSPAEVARSLRSRDGFGPTKCERLWLAHVLESERETRGRTRAIVTYDALLENWRTHLPRVARTLGLFEEGAIANAAAQIEGFLDPNLRHQVALAGFPSDDDTPADLAYAALCETASGSDADSESTLDRIAAETAREDARRPEPFISIVIVTRNGLQHTMNCLESIDRFTSEPHETIVVDNGSTDGTLAFLEERLGRDPRFRVIANTTNRGFAAANNQGLALARGDILALMNNDVIATEGWLARLVAVLDEFPNVGIVGPCTNRASGPQVIETKYGSADELALFAREVARARAGVSVEARRLVAFCWALRRSLLERIGGFDERFQTGNCEDDDYCVRAAQAGYRARIATDAFVHHAGSATFRAEKIEYADLLRSNFELFKTKWEMDPLARPEDGYPFALLAAKADRPLCPLPRLTDTMRPRADGRWWSEAKEAVAASPPKQASPSKSMCLQAGLLPNARPNADIRAFFASVGHSETLPRWASTAALDAELRRGGLALVLGGDVVFTQEALRALVAILQSHPKIAAIGPVSNAAPAAQRISPKSIDLERDLRRFVDRRRKKFGAVWHDVAHLGAFALLLRGDAALAVGGLCTDLGLPEALLDLYARLRAGRFRVACAPGIFVRHGDLDRDEGSLYDESSLTPAPASVETTVSAVV